MENNRKFLIGFMVFMVTCAIIAGLYLIFSKKPATNAASQRTIPKTQNQQGAKVLKKAPAKSATQGTTQAVPSTQAPKTAPTNGTATQTQPTPTGY